MKRYVNLVAGDISALIVSGSPSQEQLEAAKLSIISQYQEANPNPLSANHLKLISRIEMTRTKVLRVTSILECLKEGYNPSLIEELREDKYRHAFSEQSLEKDIEKVTDSLKGDVHRLAKWGEELKKITTGKQTKPLDKKDFIKSINQYNAAFGTKWSLYDDNLFVIVYCSMMNELSDYYTYITSKNGGTTD